METRSIPQIEHRPERKQFVIVRDGSIAYVLYELSGEKLDLTHTKVPKEMEGQGIGSALIERTLQYVRENNLKIIPTCPFAKTYMIRHPETQDLLSPGFTL